MRAEQEAVLSYFNQMYGAYQAMSASEREEFLAWDSLNCHIYGTHAWPGWEKYLGPFPKVEKPPQSKKKPIPAKLRWKVFERDHFTCVDCGKQSDLTVDHIIPEIHGGTLDLNNLCTRCRICNCKKGSKMPEVSA